MRPATSKRNTLIGKWLACFFASAAACFPLAGPSFASVPDSRQLVVCADQDYAPLSYPADGKPEGIDVDIVRELAKVTGLGMRVELMPWALCQRKVIEGDADMAAGMSITEKRRDLWDFATPTLTHSFSLFVESYRVTIRGVDDLLGKRVGVTAGGLPREFMEKRPGVKVVLIANYQEGFELLRKGALDAVAADTLVGGYNLSRNHIQGVSVSGGPFARLDSAIAVPKGKGELLRELNRGIAILKERGILEETIKRWEPKQVIFLRREQISRILIFSGAAFGLVLFGMMTAWIVTLRREITVRRRTERELRLNEEKFRVLVEEAPDAILVYDVDLDRFVDANAKAEQMLGYSRQELLSAGPQRFYPPEQPDSLPVAESVSSHNELVLEGEKLVFERVIRTAGGEDLNCEVRLVTLPSADRRLIRASFIDITERKRVDSELGRYRGHLEELVQQRTAERERYYMFFESSNDLMCIAGVDGRFRVTNRAWTTLLGYTPEELYQRSFTEFIHPDDVEPTQREVAGLASGGRTENFVNRYRSKEGAYRWLEWRATPAKEDMLFAVARDITDRREAEERLRRSEEFIRTILDTVDEGFIVVDRDYRILTVNKAYCRQAGGCHEEIVGRRCHDVSRGADVPCFEQGEECAVRQVFATGEPHTVFHKYGSRHGGERYMEMKAYPVKDDTGGVASVIQTITDITEKHLLEEERLKTQKLESIGTLAGGIAHDFNNLLQGIFGYLSMAKLTYDHREKSLEMLEQAEKAIHVAVGLTTQLLTFSKGGKPAKKLMDLMPAVENAIKFALSGSQTDYRIEAAEDLCMVEADEGQLMQVIQNIALNADEAMSGRGTVTVAIENADIPRDSIVGLSGGGRFVRVSIRDTGAGIPEEDLPRIFDPYFTTKQKGSGLGLAAAYSIIRNHGGVIQVESEVSKGSLFIVYLPAAKKAEEGTLPASVPAAPTKKGRVLFMDDEVLMRDVAGEMIAVLGHEIQSAADGSAAIEMFRRARDEGRPFDVVILDLTVKGGMGGEEALRHLREIDPFVKAVVSSGYAGNAIVADYRAHGFAAFLNKPYRLEALRECLNALLAEP